jgi:hypothetical protein
MPEMMGGRVGGYDESGERWAKGQENVAPKNALTATPVPPPNVCPRTVTRGRAEDLPRSGGSTFDDAYPSSEKWKQEMESAGFRHPGEN